VYHPRWHYQMTTLHYNSRWQPSWQPRWQPRWLPLRWQHQMTHTPTDDCPNENASQLFLSAGLLSVLPSGVVTWFVIWLSSKLTSGVVIWDDMLPKIKIVCHVVIVDTGTMQCLWVNLFLWQNNCSYKKIIYGTELKNWVRNEITNLKKWIRGLRRVFW
jgi:hypothetical protein